ncbi:hypothetical protein PHPALM_37158 [Phytophthora palmivora]|uniref:HAT C-terminal dimerisation domain-containing protein n=1 Tax=Phytophthora palmivora TaxID=4796 RepID=A0A2P4WY47_9STRA|nr:hypothetical protein PHPALM_37158 [Phytophthora palmivora]
MTHTRALIKTDDNTIFMILDKWLAKGLSDEITAAADYFYRRYIDPDSSGLTGDVDKWISSNFTLNKHTDFTDPRGILQSDGIIQSWLEKVILSVIVNTASCERCFSELGLIITPRRNKIDLGKARLIHIIRNQVHERNLRDRYCNDG